MNKHTLDYYEKQYVKNFGMNKKIEQSSWEENIKYYPPKTDWVVVLVSIALTLAGVWFIVEHLIGADKLIAYVLL